MLCKLCVNTFVVQIWLQKDFSPPTASIKLHKVTLHRLKPFSAAPKTAEGSAGASEQPDAAAAADPAADAEQFVQHASSNGCESLLRAASLGVHGRMLGGLVKQVSSLLLLHCGPEAIACKQYWSRTSCAHACSVGDAIAQHYASGESF